MKVITVLRKNSFLRDQRGTIAAISAIMMVVLLTTLGLVIDLGHIYTVKAELQNAADAGALAGAEALFNPTYQADAFPYPTPPAPFGPPIMPACFMPPLLFNYFPGMTPAGPFPLRYCAAVEPLEPVTYCDMAQAAAQAAVMANKADGKPLTLLPDDIQLGTYALNGQTGAWEFTPGYCSNNTNAIKVVTRKTVAVNGPVYLTFGWVLGKQYVELSAQSVAMLGWVKGIGAGRGTFPLALGDKYVPAPGEKMLVTFSPNGSDTGGWHTFFDPSTSANDLKNLVNGTTPSPEIKCGDTIYVTNGVDAAVINEMYQQFYHVRKGKWLIILPVIPSDQNYVQSRPVKGFCAFEVLEVKGPPDKTVTGYAVGGYVLPNSETGGPLGMRATLPKLIH
jgi:hypothetical protein